MIALDVGTTETPPPQFEEAVRWFRGRVPMTQAVYDALAAEAQRRAFTLAGAAALAVVSEVWRSLDATLTDGRTLADFKRDVAPGLLAQWGGSVASPAWRMEVIFRNATQRAYTHGRVEQLRDPAVARTRPFWMFDAIGDARTSEICVALDGTVLRASDPWWASHTPPCHHACRSTIRGLRANDPRVAAAGPAPDTEAQAGFGVLPEADDWTPRAGDYPADAWAAYQSNPQAYRAPAPRAPTREMPVFTPPAAPARVGFAAMPINDRLDGALLDDHAEHPERHYPGNDFSNKYQFDLGKQTRAIKGSVDADLFESLVDYTGGTYADINENLRDPAAYALRYGEERAAATAESARKVARMLDRMPRVDAGHVLFRGLTISDPAVLDQIVAADEVVSPAFLSTSRSPSMAIGFSEPAKGEYSVLYRIRGARSGALVESASQMSHEREVLFAPGARFRVTGRQRVSENRIVIDIEETP